MNPLFLVGLTIGAYFAYRFATSEDAPINPVLSSDCRNNALGDGTDWKSLVNDNFKNAVETSRVTQVPAALLLALGIHETRMRDLQGRAGEQGYLQILPKTKDMLRAKYKILENKNPRKLPDAFYFAAYHLLDTSRTLGVAIDSPTNITAYNTGATAARTLEGNTCYAQAVVPLYRTINQYFFYSL